MLAFLIDERTIKSSDFGRLIRALIHLWERTKDDDWQDRITFLEAP